MSVAALVALALSAISSVGAPITILMEMGAGAAKTPFVVEGLLWLVLSGVVGKLLVAVCLMAAGLALAGVTWIVHPFSTDPALAGTPGTAARLPATSRTAYSAALLVRRLAKCLCCLSLVFLALAAILYIALHSPPPLAETIGR